MPNQLSKGPFILYLHCLLFLFLIGTNNVVKSSPVRLFEQISLRLDNFDSENQEQFIQKYLVTLNEFDTEKGSVFIYLEQQPLTSVLYDYNTKMKWFEDYVHAFEGILIIFPIRFLGSNFNAEDKIFEPNSIQYFTTQQIMKDISNFIISLVTQRYCGISQKTRFVLIGNEYLGTLAILMRQEFPELVDVAVAKNPLQKLSTFALDTQAGEQLKRLNEDCQGYMEKYLQHVEYLFEMKETVGFIEGVKELGNMSNKEFLRLVSAIFVSLIEVEKVDKICNLLSDFDSPSTDEKFEKITEIVSEQLKIRQDLSISYSSNNLRRVISSETYVQRHLAWLQCTDLQLFHFARNEDPIYSLQIDLDFYKKFCQDAFGSVYKYSPSKILEDMNAEATISNIIRISNPNKFFERSLLREIKLGKNWIHFLCNTCDKTSDYLLQSTDSDIDKLRYQLFYLIQSMLK